jgi:hypothetical protein
LDDKVSIWTKGGYVSSFDEWKLSQKQANKSPCIPAYVPSIEQSKYGTILKECGLILGSNQKPTDEECGKIFRKIQCSQNPEHHKTFRHVHCNDPGCPICYTKFAGRMADRITERVMGFKSVYKDDYGEEDVTLWDALKQKYYTQRRKKRGPNSLYHLIFWPERREGRPYAGLTEAFKDANRLMKNMGVTGAAIEYHPYRIKAELKPYLRRYRTIKGLNGRAGFWKLAHDDVLNLGGIENYLVSGPHFHGPATGYLVNAKEYSEKHGGAGYKKKRYLDSEKSVHEVAYYISTHAGREWCKSSVRYFGNMSYRMLAREKVKEEIKNIRCPVCSSKLEEYDCDDTGVIREKLKDNITEKVKYYLYWKKGQPKPAMLDHTQCLITRFCRD